MGFLLIQPPLQRLLAQLCLDEQESRWYLLHHGPWLNTSVMERTQVAKSEFYGHKIHLSIIGDFSFIEVEEDSPSMPESLVKLLLDSSRSLPVFLAYNLEEDHAHIMHM